MCLSQFLLLDLWICGTSWIESQGGGRGTGHSGHRTGAELQSADGPGLSRNWGNRGEPLLKMTPVWGELREKWKMPLPLVRVLSSWQSVLAGRSVIIWRYNLWSWRGKRRGWGSLCGSSASPGWRIGTWCPLELRFGINHIATRVRVRFKVEIMLLAGSEHS